MRVPAARSSTEQAKHRITQEPNHENGRYYDWRHKPGFHHRAPSKPHARPRGTGLRTLARSVFCEVRPIAVVVGRYLDAVGSGRPPTAEVEPLIEPRRRRSHQAIAAFRDLQIGEPSAFDGVAWLRSFRAVRRERNWSLRRRLSLGRWHR